MKYLSLQLIIILFALSTINLYSQETLESTLPVELVSFTAESDVSGNIVLNWITSVEKNNDFFTILKTKDGIYYETVGNYEGAGNSNYVIKYSYIDNNPYNGISYYKLKQTDYNGEYSYSELVQVNHQSFADQMFNVFPNPVSPGQNPYMQLKGMESNQEVLVVVLSVLGQELYSKVLFTDDRGGVLEAVDPYKRLSKGTYLIIGTSNDHIYKRKLVIK